MSYHWYTDKTMSRADSPFNHTRQRIAPGGRSRCYAPAFLPTLCCSLCSVWFNGGHHDQCFLAESVTLRYGSEYPRISTQIGLSVVGTGQRNTASKHSLKYYFCSAHGGSRLPSLSALRLWIALFCPDPAGDRLPPGRHRKRCLLLCSDFILTPSSFVCQ